MFSYTLFGAPTQRHRFYGFKNMLICTSTYSHVRFCVGRPLNAFPTNVVAVKSSGLFPCLKNRNTSMEIGHLVFVVTFNPSSSSLSLLIGERCPRTIFTSVHMRRAMSLAAHVELLSPPQDLMLTAVAALTAKSLHCCRVALLLRPACLLRLCSVPKYVL